MTFLPIVERELRVASRRHVTYWLRVGAAAFLLLIFGAMLMISTLAPAMPWTAGQMQFSALKWLAFLFAASAGVFLTSDSLSEEKREGTLGLLFLTDLRGYDVVLGKLMSHSLQALYGLLAGFPILALPLLVGGVTGTEFARSLLTICNTLFLSLSIGIFISSISRDVMKAMNLTLLLMLLFLVGFSWLDFGLAGWEDAKFKPILSLASPGRLFLYESGFKPADFWAQLGLQNVCGWIFLALASICIPRAWQEKSNSAKGTRQSLRRWWRFGGGGTQINWRKKLLSRDPIIWLALRDRWMTRLVWMAMMVASGYLVYSYDRHPNSADINNYFRAVQWFLTLGVVLWIGSQACRLFVEGIRNGAMELILVTPITPREIVQGQWVALQRTFLIPVLFIFVLHFFRGFEVIHSLVKTTPMPKGNLDGVTHEIVTLITGVTTLLGTFLAVAWFGMWMGMTSRKTSSASFKTICFVCVIPLLIDGFLQLAVIRYVVSLKLPLWTSGVLASIFELVKNCLFIIWSRNQLLTRFTEMVNRGGQGIITRRSPLMPITVSPAPPLIS